MSIYTIISILIILLLIFLNKQFKNSKRPSAKEYKAQRIQEQQDKIQRAIDRMPRFGFYIYHIAPAGTSLDQGYIGMTNTLDALKSFMFSQLKDGTHNNAVLQKAWDELAFCEDDFHILHENLSGRKAIELMVQLRSENNIGWNQTKGGWAWNDDQYLDKKTP